MWDIRAEEMCHEVVVDIMKRDDSAVVECPTEFPAWGPSPPASATFTCTAVSTLTRLVQFWQRNTWQLYGDYLNFTHFVSVSKLCKFMKAFLFAEKKQ